MRSSIDDTLGDVDDLPQITAGRLQGREFE
jgi:hypothetical protein